MTDDEFREFLAKLDTIGALSDGLRDALRGGEPITEEMLDSTLDMLRATALAGHLTGARPGAGG